MTVRLINDIDTAESDSETPQRFTVCDTAESESFFVTTSGGFKEKIIKRIWGTTAAQEIQNLSYL